MEIKTFKIRLRYCSDYEIYKWSNIDELPNDYDLSDLRCEYNWIEVMPGYSHDSRDYKLYNAYNRVNSGYTDDDVIMDIEYKNGLLEITLVANDSFDKLVTCIRDNKLVTRTLFDWVKLRICGQVSDGIGENEVGYYRDENGEEREVWLGDFITDEPTGEWGFDVGEPISVEDNIEIVESMRMPGFTETYKRLVDEYHEAWKYPAFNDKFNAYKTLENLRNENIIYTANKLNELNKNI